MNKAVEARTLAPGVELDGTFQTADQRVLDFRASAFLADLHRRFEPSRQALLAARRDRQAQLDGGETPDFPAQTRELRAAAWQARPAPADLQNRKVEITGPVERKMVINALNSGAKCFMADFEDANSPTWDNCIQGQLNLQQAVRGTLEHRQADGREYRLGPQTATLMVRPRGLHLVDRHLLVDGAPIAGALLDFGLFCFHNARALLDKGSGPYFYLPKLENHHEAAWWNDVFEFTERQLGLPHACIRATVLIETILAALEMDEIIHALRERVVGLNAGRWDYIFSIIKKFAGRPDFLLPDRAQVTMTVPFMRAYTERLVQTCHRRGVHAIGGMAAFIPNRRDPEVTGRALAAVRADKEREADDGFDGSWVAHPDLVPVALEVFEAKLGDAPNQLDRQRPEVDVTAAQLLDVRIPGGRITADGVLNNVQVCLRYLTAWLQGNGAVAIYNLMEDAATAEIARAQLWQWHQHHAQTDDGRLITADWIATLANHAQTEIAVTLDDRGRTALAQARTVFDQLVFTPTFQEFLTLPAYELLTSPLPQ
jgi:malate synthase